MPKVMPSPKRPEATAPSVPEPVAVSSLKRDAAPTPTPPTRSGVRRPVIWTPRVSVSPSETSAMSTSTWTCSGGTSSCSRSAFTSRKSAGEAFTSSALRETTASTAMRRERAGSTVPAANFSSSVVRFLAMSAARR